MRTPGPAVQPDGAVPVTWHYGEVTGPEDLSVPPTRRSRRAAAQAAPVGPVVPSDTQVIAALPLRPAGAVRYWTSALTLVVAGVLSLGAAAGTGPMAAAFALAAVLLATGWPDLLGLPSPRGTTSVVALAGVAVAVAAVTTRTEPRLAWLAFAVAACLVAEFAHQLLRRDGRPRLVESIAGSVLALFVLASFSAVLALPRSPVTAGGVLAWAAAVAAALLTEAVLERLSGPLPVRGVLAVPLAVLVAVVVGGVCGAAAAAVSWPAGAVAGGLSAVVALVLHRLLVQLPAAGRAPGWLALAVAPLAGSGMVGYVVLRLALG